MSHKIVPTISSGTAGPLGVLHLPRLWQKMCLGAAGKLADGYSNCGPGYDMMVVNALGLDRDALAEFVAANFPTYVQFERYVSENAKSLDAETVKKLNDSITGYQHTAETRQAILASVGLPDGSPTDAVSLNNLDDWQEFHAAELE